MGKGKRNRYKIFAHLYSTNTFLKNKIKKLGMENIIIEKIAQNLSEQEAFKLEKYWIKRIGRRNLETGPLCNLTDGGEGSSGWVCSNIVKEKISKSLCGKNNPRYGTTISEEHRKKLKVINKGSLHPMYNRKHSEESKQKMKDYQKIHGNAFKGKIHSEKSREKMSIALSGENSPNFGKTHSEETKEKIRNARKNFKYSIESKQKMSQAHAQLSNSIVQKIRVLRTQGISRREIANMFNISELRRIRDIELYKTYRYID